MQQGRGRKPGCKNDSSGLADLGTLTGWQYIHTTLCIKQKPAYAQPDLLSTDLNVGLSDSFPLLNKNSFVFFSHICIYDLDKQSSASCICFVFFVFLANKLAYFCTP